MLQRLFYQGMTEEFLRQTLPLSWQLTSFFVTPDATPFQVTPDEDTRSECRNVGSSMQCVWTLYSFKHKHSSEQLLHLVPRSI